MVQELLRFREDVFPNYIEENFLQELQRLASVERRQTSSSTGRLLVEFSRSPARLKCHETYPFWLAACIFSFYPVLLWPSRCTACFQDIPSFLWQGSPSRWTRSFWP